jgi:hypothetical protein
MGMKRRSTPSSSPPKPAPPLQSRVETEKLECRTHRRHLPHRLATSLATPLLSAPIKDAFGLATHRCTHYHPSSLSSMPKHHPDELELLPPAPFIVGLIPPLCHPFYPSKRIPSAFSPSSCHRNNEWSPEARSHRKSSDPP